MDVVTPRRRRPLRWRIMTADAFLLVLGAAALMFIVIGSARSGPGLAPKNALPTPFDPYAYSAARSTPAPSSPVSPTPRPTLRAWPQQCLTEPQSIVFHGAVSRCLIDLRARPGGEEDRRYILEDGAVIDLLVRPATGARPLGFGDPFFAVVDPGSMHLTLVDHSGDLFTYSAVGQPGLWIGAQYLRGASVLPFPAASDLMGALLPPSTPDLHIDLDGNVPLP